MCSVMSRTEDKSRARQGRRDRVRRKVRGTGDRPRLCVFRSLGHIYAQIIDDDAARTIVSASSLRLDVSAQQADPAGEKRTSGRKMLRSEAVGRLIAERAIEKGVRRVVFDRGGFLYHGRVAALAEAARKNGLEF